jgi:carbon starvation protein CstA
MRTIVAAGTAEAEQTLPEAAVKWILKTEALWLALLVAAILAAMVAQATSIRPQPMFGPFRGVVWSAVAIYVAARLQGVLVSRAVPSAVLFAVLMAEQLLQSGNTEPRVAAAQFPLNPNSMVWRTR